ncbi:hypothetical protein [Nocardioides mesophilus]|uniref:Uncharacterized protein n=1 Tax=Nocardioides mesophilus TaxID=433659 RepID=A0A7G9REM9_9ACTN|nr:hypothetical protein [Nocardioides mesophilus]QNN54054.1 hypothetical protein H9L09_06650 [Nocardioides mesophilus]
MDLLSVLALVTVFPWAGLAFLLWMARLEDGLPAAVRRAERSPEPPPVLAIPVQRATSPGETPPAGRPQRRTKVIEAAYLGPLRHRGDAASLEG